MLNVIVKRKNWLRGRPNSFLLNKDGEMCCLGFACLAAGHTQKQIKGIRCPASVPNLKIKTLFCPEYGTDNEISHKLMDINDSIHITDKTREKRLILHGKKAKIKFKFVN